MTTDEDTGYRPLSEILERLSPERRADVEYRARRGEIPVLPEDIIIEPGRMFIEGIGWSQVPGLDPANIKLENIELLFVIRRGDSLMLEVTLKNAPPLSDKFQALKKSSAFRTKSAAERYLRKASPAVASEVRSRLKRGQVVFLPDQFRVAADGVYLPLKDGTEEPVGIDPKTIQDVLLVFAVPNQGRSDFLEVLWKTH